jgi:hypothetical protein
LPHTFKKSEYHTQQTSLSIAIQLYEHINFNSTSDVVFLDKYICGSSNSTPVTEGELDPSKCLLAKVTQVVGRAIPYMIERPLEAHENCSNLVITIIDDLNYQSFEIR